MRKSDEKKLKIAMLGHKRVPGREGGVEVVVEELATRMVKNGHDVTVYNRSKKGVKIGKEYKGVRIITIPTIEHKNTDAVVYSFFASLHALFGGYDVIHYHAIGPSAMLIIPHFFGKRTVVTVHGLNYKTPKWKGFAEKYILMGEKIAARFADEIITLSKEQQRYFKEKYNRETRLIPNGTIIQSPKEPKEIVEKWSLNKNGYILFLSRVVPGKGLETLIEAYKQIDTDLPLIIAGDSEFVSDFRQQMHELAADDERIHFIGFVEGDTLVELYSNAKLFVFPSEAEGMPMCLLEALSYNTSCLVSDIPENVDVGEHFVQTFNVGDVEHLKKQLEHCLENYDELFKENSADYIEEKYNWDCVVKQTLEVYEG